MANALGDAQGSIVGVSAVPGLGFDDPYGFFQLRRFQDFMIWICQSRFGEVCKFYFKEFSLLYL